MVFVVTLAVASLADARVDASPYDVAWMTLHFGLGGPADLSGDLDERLQTTPCEKNSCQLGSRGVFGVGFRRWGFELHVASNPVDDGGAMDTRDRDRFAFRYGPVTRFTVLRRFGFDVSVRAGLHYGRLLGSTSTMTEPDLSCPIEQEGDCPPIETKYEPPSHRLWAISLGATLLWRVRVEQRGFFGVQVDVDRTTARVEFPDGTRTGSISSRTYGFVVGSMFDIDR